MEAVDDLAAPAAVQQGSLLEIESDIDEAQLVEAVDDLTAPAAVHQGSLTVLRY